MMKINFTSILLTVFVFMPLASHGVEKSDSELEVAEAVYRFILSNKDFSYESVNLYFLSYKGNKDVPIALFEKLNLSNEFADKVINNLSDSTIAEDSGVYSRITGERGVIFQIREIEFIGDREAKVVGGFYEGAMSFSANTFKLKLCNGRWVVESSSLDMVG